MRRALFRGTQGAATTIAVPVPVIAGCVGVHVSWPDATTAATIVLEVSSFDSDQAPWFTGAVLAGEGNAAVAVVDADKWPDSGAVIDPIVAGAEGSRLINVSGLRQQRARLLITSTAICTWDIRDGLNQV
jgi:hypothetical protein